MKYSELLKESKSKKEIFTHVRPLEGNCASFCCKASKKDFIACLLEKINMYGDVESYLTIDKDGYVGYVCGIDYEN